MREAVSNAFQSAKVPESIAAKNQNVTKNVIKEKEILALLREDASMTTAEMAQKLSVNRRTAQRELEKLKKKKILYVKVAGVMDIGKFMSRILVKQRMSNWLYKYQRVLGTLPYPAEFVSSTSNILVFKHIFQFNYLFIICYLIL